jgi:hypothetical protein
MWNGFDIQTTVDMIQTLVCVTVVINAVEILFEWEQYKTGGMESYALLKLSRSWMVKGCWAPVLSLFLESSRYLFLVILELILSILLIIHIFAQLSWLFLFLILLVRLLSALRNSYGLDGAHQMQVIILASLTFFSLSSDPLVKFCCICFICFQALLSYLTAGVVKARSSIWRSGAAISNVLQLSRFSNEACAQCLMKWPLLSKCLCWSIIVYECLFPLFVLTGTWTCLLVLGVGILFHFAIALVMGLNSFFWSFIATYPAILFFANTFQLFLFSHLK